MKRIAVIAALFAASPLSVSAQSVDGETTIAACSRLGDPGDITQAQLNCLRGALAKAEVEMTTAFKWRLGLTGAAYRQRLTSVQRLWQQSMQANCDFFGGNPGSAARMECRIKAMVERKQTLSALD